MKFNLKWNYDTFRDNLEDLILDEYMQCDCLICRYIWYILLCIFAVDRDKR